MDISTWASENQAGLLALVGLAVGAAAVAARAWATWGPPPKPRPGPIAQTSSALDALGVALGLAIDRQRTAEAKLVELQAELIAARRDLARFAQLVLDADIGEAPPSARVHLRAMARKYLAESTS